MTFYHLVLGVLSVDLRTPATGDFKLVNPSHCVTVLTLVSYGVCHSLLSRSEFAPVNIGDDEVDR